MSLQLVVSGLFVVVTDQPLVAVAEVYGREIGHEDEAVAAEVEIAMYCLAHHAANVRAVRIRPALVEFARDGGTADVIVLLDDNDVESRFRQVGGVREPVVTGADNDRVIAAHRSTSCAALWPARPVRSPAG